MFKQAYEFHDKDNEEIRLENGLVSANYAYACLSCGLNR